MKRTSILVAAVLAATAFVDGGAVDEHTQDKRVVVQIISGDGELLAVGLVTIEPNDSKRPLGELVEAQVGRQWWGFRRGVVYRFSERTQAWEAIMTRDVSTTETVVGAMSAGLSLSELRNGDVIRLSGEAAF